MSTSAGPTPRPLSNRQQDASRRLPRHPLHSKEIPAELSLVALPLRLDVGVGLEIDDHPAVGITEDEIRFLYALERVAEAAEASAKYGPPCSCLHNDKGMVTHQCFRCRLEAALAALEESE